MIAPASPPLDAGRTTAAAKHAPSQLWASAVGHKAHGWLLPVGVVVVWELLALAGVLPPHWFPAPTRVMRTLIDLGARGTLGRHVAATLLRVIVGFACGVATGSALAIATGRSPKLRRLLDPSLHALRSIPSLAWVPLFLLWFGIGETSKVALIALGVFFPVYLNLTGGLETIDRRLLEVAELYSYRRARLIRHVLLPATLPAYITGLRSGLGLGWMFVVAAELMGASRGLGYLLVDGQTTSRPELVMASILSFAALGKLTDLPLAAWSKRWLDRGQGFGSLPPSSP